MTDPVDVAPDEPGIGLSVLFFVVYFGLLATAFVIDPDLQGRGNHPLAEACLFATFVWGGVWVGLANRLAHKSWFFRMWIQLSRISAKPVRDPVVLDFIGPGLAVIGTVMCGYRIWQYLAG